jgi:hypothetical protein
VRIHVPHQNETRTRMSRHAAASEERFGIARADLKP